MVAAGFPLMCRHVTIAGSQFEKIYVTTGNILTGDFRWSILAFHIGRWSHC